MMAMQIKTILTVVMVAGLMAACVSTPSRLSSPDKYAHKVQVQLNEGDLRAAESTLGEMELYYPVSVPTQAMQLKLISAYYKSAEMDRTVVAAKRYSSMFPHADDVDQVHYLSGIANYDRGLKYLTEGPYERSPLHAKVAKESFAALLRCCAESRYASEVSEKAAYLDEALAQYEFGLMRAELLNGNRAAAIAKGKYIVNTYPTTTAAGVTEVVQAAMDKPEVLDRLLIATALTINQDEAEVLAARAGMAIAAPVVAGADADTAQVAAPVISAAATTPVEPLAVIAPVVAEAAPKMAPPVAEERASKTTAAVSLMAGSPRYTVQLGSSRKLATVQRYIQRLGLADGVRYEPRMVNGEPWHAALYGAYADMAAAQRAADELMVRTGVKDLWVRRLADTPSVEPRTIMAASETTKARPAEVAKARATGKYAIQVASDQNLDSLRTEMRGMKLEGQVEYHRRVVDNKAIYSALYGAYADFQSARADLPGLQGRINKDGLWIRALNEEQRLEVE
jgi:outer membrane protein assembly factor BamD